MSAQKIKTERGAARHTSKKIRISYTTSTSAPTTDAGTCYKNPLLFFLLMGVSLFLFRL